MPSGPIPRRCFPSPIVHRHGVKFVPGASSNCPRAFHVSFPNTRDPLSQPFVIFDASRGGGAPRRTPSWNIPFLRPVALGYSRFRLGTNRSRCSTRRAIVTRGLRRLGCLLPPSNRRCRRSQEQNVGVYDKTWGVTCAKTVHIFRYVSDAFGDALTVHPPPPPYEE